MTTATATHPTTRTGVVAAYLLAVAAVAVGAATLVPDYVVEPMGRMTHYMALIGPENPAHPWTFLAGMGLAVILAYGVILPAVFGKLPPRAAELGTLLLAPVTVAFAAYLVRWALWQVTLGGDSHGALDTISVVVFVLTPLPVLAAAVLLLATGRLNGWWVFLTAALLHVGMLTGMLAADLFGGVGGVPHVG